MENRRKRHTPDEIVKKLQEADAMLNAGNSVSAVIDALGVSEATYHRWRNQFGGIKADEAKRLKRLEEENSLLRRLVADQALDLQMLRELYSGNC